MKKQYDQEQRQEFRLTAKEIVYIEMVSSYIDEATPSVVAISNSLDISANGICIVSDKHIAEGNIHSICVQLENPKRRLELVAEVKWSRPTSDGKQYHIGFEFFESEGTDIEQWKEIIAERCGG